MTTPWTPDTAPRIRTQADLEVVWRNLMEPLGFAETSIWLLLIDADDRATPLITNIEECPGLPDPELLAGFGHVAREVRDEQAPGGRWAILRSRPGGGGATETDRVWARSLTAACREAGVGCEVVHLATDHDLVPLPLDDLVESRAS